MCLIAFAYKSHPDYKLILAANRDEFYERPARGAQFWDEEGLPEILAGKDLKAGGTWMGINKDKKWGALTNYRDPSWKRQDPPSRGELVLEYLNSGSAPKAFMSQLSGHAQEYMGFNLLAGNTEELFHYSNHSKEITRLEPGIHGLSNALLNSPWPKLEQAKSDLQRIISSEGFSSEDLFEMLTNADTAPDDQLPDTGIPKKWEKAISSVFIKTENYGTRCSTVLMIGQQDQVTFIERRYNPIDASVIEINHFNF